MVKFALCSLLRPMFVFKVLAVAFCTNAVVATLVVLSPGEGVGAVVVLFIATPVSLIVIRLFASNVPPVWKTMLLAAVAVPIARLELWLYRYPSKADVMVNPASLYVLLFMPRSM